MDSDECFLTIKIIYSQKSFDIKSEIMPSVRDIKNKSLEIFNIPKKFENFMKFSYAKDFNQNCFIENDIDIIKNSSKKSFNELILILYLLIESNNSLNEYSLKDSINNSNILEENEKYKKENEKYKKELNILKNEIEKLKEENEKSILYSNTLKEEINKLKKLENENYALKNEIKELKIEINKKSLLLKDLENNINKKADIDSNELFRRLLKKNEEINQLNKKLSYPIELIEGEKIIFITLIAGDDSLVTNIICKNTDKFINIENKLYEEFPEYFENNYCFTIKGKEINRFKNFDQNGIFNNDIIILHNK